MTIYIDEDLAGDLLTRLLEQAGDDVVVSVTVGTRGRSDAVQLTCAVHDGRVCLTGNHSDFEKLHLLIQEAHGKHAGILVVRQDNDPTRDLTAKGIVAAIRKLESVGVPIANEYVILNHWR